MSKFIWPQVPIPVCWALGDAEFAQTATERNWVRSAVERTWVANSGAEFSGWDKCPTSGYYGISIGVEDNAAAAPHSYVGNSSARYAPSMMLNFTFKNWSPTCPRGRGLETCVGTVAIHEFGHALGFVHEQDRADTPATCDALAVHYDAIAYGTTLIGAWDLASVMNYCNSRWNGDGKLSAIDIEMVQKFYGMSRAKSTLYTVLRSSLPAQIKAFDLSTRMFKATVNLPSGEPTQMFSSSNGRNLYVFLNKGQNVNGELLTIDTASNSVIRTTAMDNIVQGSYYSSADGSRIYAIDYYRIRAYSSDTGELLKTVDLPYSTSTKSGTPAAFDDKNNVYVEMLQYGTYAARLHRISLDQGKIVQSWDLSSGTRNNNFPSGFILSRDGKKVTFNTWLNDSGLDRSVAELDLETNTRRTVAAIPPSLGTNLLPTEDGTALSFTQTGSNTTVLALYDMQSGRTMFTDTQTPGSIRPFYHAQSKSVFSWRCTYGGAILQFEPQPDGTYQRVTLDAATVIASPGVCGGPSQPFVIVNRS